MPTLSVVILACHDRSSLHNTVGSLLTGSAGDPEIIMVDDGSAAGAPPAAGALAAEDVRVRIIHQDHAGGAAACNAALAAASGDYVGFLSEGDEAGPGWARTLLAAAAGGHPAIVRGEVVVVRPHRHPEVQSTCALVAQPTPLHWTACMGAAMYRRGLLVRHGLHFAATGPDGERDFQVRAVVAAMLEHAQIALCPQARLLRHAGRPGAAGRSEVAASLEIYAALHELFVQHRAALPASGVGVQYLAWIERLFALTRIATLPDDAAAANALAQRLNRECPQYAALEQIRDHLRQAPPGTSQPPPPECAGAAAPGAGENSPLPDPAACAPAPPRPRVSGR